ncbi:MAG TPA: glutathione S-transferase N-terminal domain-containing protein [Acidocella sp.]|jgi:glutathione S-transferase|uniref:glutathione S-transferase family protein n=1 Tax=Acidocella sp. TaxID=50710 RepID=UPI002C979DE8|nr:glutathione S-transferase N-terminal domain-containing protein [Acidocella sp.]HVE23427.1 glutathione S-transferase N-terminal domain-containing protein [Acidocella sp.]
MKLFYAPNACSMGIHLLLEEIGEPYQLEKVDFASGAQYKAPFVEINPKSKVPVLQRDDGSYLTEFPAIALYLARAKPAAGLLPAGLDAEARALELLDYLIATVHMRGFTRIFRPTNFAPAADEEWVKQTGKEMIVKAFDLLAPVLGEQDYILGKFSIVEGALFFLEYWARNRAKIQLPANFEAHLDRLLARPATARMLKAEGLV